MTVINHQIVLASRPAGAASVDNFRMVEAPLGPLGDGQVRVRNHYLSLDPYMRGRMNDAKNYAAPQPLNEVMIGGTAGEVVESNNPKFAGRSMAPATAPGCRRWTTAAFRCRRIWGWSACPASPRGMG